VVTDAQLMMFLQVAHEYQLNPFTKEIYAFPSKGGGIVPMVPIDGWAKIINRHPMMDGLEFEDLADEKGRLVAIRCRIYRKDRSHPTEVTEYLSECFDEKKDTWVRWTARMLRHKSLIQCARIAFALAGIYDPDEAERILESEDRRELAAPRPIERPRPVLTPAKPCEAVQQSDKPQAEAAREEVQPDRQRAGESAPSSEPAAGATVGEVAMPSVASQPSGTELFPPKADAVRPSEENLITENQRKKLYAAARSVYGKEEYEKKLHAVLKDKFQVEHVSQIKKEQFDEIYHEVGRTLGLK